MAKEHIHKITKNILFYRGKLRFLNRLGIVFLFVIIALLSYSIFRISSIQKPIYFATTSDGRLIKVTPAE